MQRLVSLDVIRGFALCGILLVNAPPLLGDSGIDVTYSPDPDTTYTPVHEWLELLVAQRFFPIFSLLFGIGFGIMWRSGRRRGLTPAQVRWALVRRIAVLGALGAVHQYFHPGEALLPYALFAAALLLPLTFVPWKRWTAAALMVVGAVLLVVMLAPGGGMALIPGLFVLGFTAALLGVPEAAERRGDLVALVGCCAAMVVIPLTVLQAGLPVVDLMGPVPAIAGLLMATVYVAALLLALHTSVAPALVWALAPLGRMALTNYLAATAAVLLLAHQGSAWGLVSGDRGAWVTLAWCVVILAVQLTYSRWWLSRFGQGPLEALWRRATWGRRAHEVSVSEQPVTAG